MKKIIKIMLCITLALTLCACGKKEEITSKQAKKIFESNSFSVYDSTSQMEDKDIKSIISANNGKFQVEFTVYNNEDGAKKLYDVNKKYFENSNKTKGSEVSSDGYIKYVQKLSDTYNVIEKVGNSVLYVSTSIEYKNEVKDIIKKLGY